jgi:hypothetical protein
MGCGSAWAFGLFGLPTLFFQLFVLTPLVAWSARRAPISRSLLATLLKFVVPCVLSIFFVLLGDVHWGNTFKT